MKNLKVSETHAGHGFTQFELTNYLLLNLNKFNLKPTSKLVLMFLSSCYNPKHKEVFPKQRTIADKLGISEASVIRAIQELHKEGLIISERKYTNCYVFTSKILSDCPRNLQAGKLQNVSKETCKLQGHVSKQKTETNKQQTVRVDDYKILKDYALKHNAKNVSAYVNWLIREGKAQEIIEAENQILRRANAMKQAGIQAVNLMREARITADTDDKTEFFNSVRRKLKQ